MAGTLHGPCLCPFPIGFDCSSTWAWVLRAQQEREKESPQLPMHVGLLTPMEHISISPNSSPTRIFIAQHS